MSQIGKIRFVTYRSGSPGDSSGPQNDSASEDLGNSVRELSNSGAEVAKILYTPKKKPATYGNDTTA